MLFHDFIRRKLTSLLQPWFGADPELEVNFGFLRSTASLNNVRLNTSALNELLEDPSRYCFKAVTVEHLIFHFSPWSSPAFTVVVRGLRFALSLGEATDGVKWMRGKDMITEKKDKVITGIDPEGCALHAAIRRIADITTRTRGKSLLNTFLVHSEIQFHDVLVLFQSLNSHSALSGSLFSKKVKAGSQMAGTGSFSRGLAHSLFIPCEESSFSIDVTSFEIRLNGENRRSCIIPSTNMSALVTLKHLQFTSLCLHVPQLIFTFHPADLRVILLFYALLSKKSEGVRPGRFLWKILACRMRSLLLSTNPSMLKVGKIVCLWLRYVKSYENLLIFVGYPIDDLMKKSVRAMFQDTTYSSSVKSQWNLVTQFENDLPPEAIASARHIARIRIASRGPVKNARPYKVHHNRLLCKLPHFFVLILSKIANMLLYVTRLLLLHKVLVIFSENRKKFIASLDDSHLESCISLIVQEISISVSPDDVVEHSPKRKSVIFSPVSYQDLLSFRILVDAIIIRYMINVSEQGVVFASGCWKVLSSPLGKSCATAGSKTKETSKKKVDDLQIMWAEPAPVIDVFASTYDGVSVPHLICVLGEVWLNWKEFYAKFDGKSYPNLMTPWIICEVKNSLACSYLNDFSYWSGKFGAIVGRLYLHFNYFSMLTTLVLLRQLGCATCSTDSMKKSVVLDAWVRDPPAMNSISKCKSYIRKIKLDTIRMVPRMHMEIGVLIVGPHIQLSLFDNMFYGENTGDHLVTNVLLDICNIEFTVSPKLEGNLEISSEKSTVCDRSADDTVLEPQELDMPRSDVEAYSCQGQISLNAHLKLYGLEAYLTESADSLLHQIIVLSPLTSKLQYVRRDHHSFGSMIVGLSATCCCVATGFTMLLFLDEWCTLTKVIFGVIHESIPFAMYRSSGDLRYQELSYGATFYSDTGIGQTVSRSSRIESLVSNIRVIVHCTCELKSFDFILNNSRKSNRPENYSKIMPNESRTGSISSLHDTNCHGIYISVNKLMTKFVCSEKDLDFIINVAGTQCMIFRYLNDSKRCLDKFELKNLLSSLNFVTEASTSQSRICLSLRNLEALSSVELNNSDEPCLGKSTMFFLGNFPLVLNTENLENHWLSANIVLSGIYVVGCEVKDTLVSEHMLDELSAEFSVGGAFQTLSWQSKGGSILLEPLAVALFIECCTSCCHRFVEIFSASQALEPVTVSQEVRGMASTDSHLSKKPQQVQLHNLIWNHLEMFSLSLSHVSLMLVDRDELGRFRELLFEVNFHLNLEHRNMRRKISILTSKFSLLSRLIQTRTEHKSLPVRRLRFPSVLSDDSSSYSNDESGSPLVMQQDAIQLGNADASGSRLTSSQYGFPIDSFTFSLPRKSWNFGPPNYILKDLHCFLVVQEPLPKDEHSPVFSDDIWVGDGSVSGLVISISLTEIKMMHSTFESFSNVLIRKKTNIEAVKQSNHLESEGRMEEMIPDGAIVAIQDVDQHMYIVVEGSMSKYNIAGAVHYSLVGVRALFQVKYHNPGRWKSKIQYFSLVSLYAKNGAGEPLRLSSNPRSKFVGLSCANDSGPALWRMLFLNNDVSYEDTFLLESSSPPKRTFYLINKKNDCAVTNTDGSFEFVGTPGSVFKWKVFTNPSPGNSFIQENCSLDSFQTNLRSDQNITDIEDSSRKRNPSGITITVDNVILTLVHELPHNEEKSPLFRGTVLPSKTIIQISNSKFRVMNSSGVAWCYFDAQKNSWIEFVQPFEFYIFYCSKLKVHGSETILDGVPSRFYAKITEINVSVNELSLDIMLFVIGKLDIAGPFAIKNLLVLTNCCKIQNQSGLTLLCQFFDHEGVSISAWQSTTIFLRYLALENQPQDASLFSLQLADQDFQSTPIHLSLLETRKLAWRTHIISSQDSKSFPGPLIFVEIFRGIKDGLSIVVSPMLKIHNDTDFSLELRFQRPQHKETEFAHLMLNAGDTMDDFITSFGAVDVYGGSRKALTSLTVGGNFIFSFRPDIPDNFSKLNQASMEWSDDLQGGKPIHLSGVFDKLSYKVRNTFSSDSAKCSIKSANCVRKSEDNVVARIHFLILTVRKGIPVTSPDNFGYAPNKDSPIALQELKEFFFLPTVQVSNLLHTEIHVNLTDTDPHINVNHESSWSNATIPCGSAVKFYANPETIYFTVTLTLFDAKSKPVNSSDWVRKLLKHKNDIPHLDIELDFDGGKYFATLRLSCSHRGTLEAFILTPYALHNDTNSLLFFFSAGQKSLSSDEFKRFGSNIPPTLGSCVLPTSITSWFLKCHKLHLKLAEENTLEAQLDIDSLSGLTEIDLESGDISGIKNIARLGVSLKPSGNKEVQYQIISFSSRYVLCNESEKEIAVRQSYMEEMEEVTSISSKQQIALRLKSFKRNKRETTVIENLLRKHSKSLDDLSLFIQFRLNESGLSWSGPICVASLGRFFLKFRKSFESTEDQVNHSSNDDTFKFAAVHIVEEGSSTVLRFHQPPDMNLPYRIENFLHDAPISYYQKGSLEPEVLGAGISVSYVWDNLTLPHKLVVQLDDVHILREINLDKVRSWKPFYRNKQTRGLGFHAPFENKTGNHKQTTYSHLIGSEAIKVGFEVYAEGVTRVLRLCNFSESHKVDFASGSRTKIRLRISYFSVHILENTKQEVDQSETPKLVPIIIGRFERISLDSMLTSQQKCYQFRVQSLSVDEKWIGAPFATMLRHHRSEKSDANDCIFRAALILLQSSSGVKQVKHLAIALQPLNLNLDEETLMKIVPFWRKSLSDSSASRQQYYFDHFEIHPIKIMASFLPGDSYYSYSSTQETLRSLLHSVIKMPAIQNKTVELNGVLVTHALMTLRELTIKCAQHYSWYSLRAIYIAKGSPLLPPAFASVFDDIASSSLDVFFDPSSGLLNLPGVTIGTLKLVSKFIDNKGFSGTRRYFGDLGKTLKTAGSNVMFAAVTEISDSVLRGAEISGLNGMVGGFHKGILKLAMEPSVLGSAFMEGGPDRKIKVDRSPGIDELYIEGYLQAMLDTMYKQEYLRVKVLDNQVVLKNLPPSSALINEIMETVKGFLASKALLKGESSSTSSLRYIRGEREWRIGPTLLTLCEHLFVSFAIRFLRKQAGKVVGRIKSKRIANDNEEKDVPADGRMDPQNVKLIWKWGIGKFVLSGIVAYIDGRLCRNIPNPLARRIVSGFLLSFLDTSNDESQ